MKITITDGNLVSNFDVETDQSIQDIKALVEVQVLLSIYFILDGSSFLKITNIL